MVAIKKSVLQLLALGLLTSGMAMGQQLICESYGVPAEARSESKADLMGDITFICRQAVPGAAGDDQVVNITVDLLSVAVTNNIDFGSGEDIVDAVLVIDDSNGTPVVIPDGWSPQLGRLGANGKVIWDGVTLPYPNDEEVTTVRITSIRGNAASTGVTQVGVTANIQALVSVSPPTNVIITDPLLTIASVEVSLIADITGEIAGLQCVDMDETGDNTTTVTVTEGFASAFKTIGVPSFTPGSETWESGYEVTDSNNGAGASNATQFRVVFADIPDGVTVTVPNVVTNGLTPPLLLNTAATCDDTGVTDVTGSGEVIYNVCDTNVNAPETASIEAVAVWTAGGDPADVGTGTVSVSYNPIGGPEVAVDETFDEPRFVDTSEPQDFVSVEKCVTTILWPFVTNQSGFDTGLVVSNTSDDWGLSNADPQDGDCEIHYIGTDSSGVMPDDDITTEEVVAGDQLVWLLSSGGTHGLVGAPDFQGYVLAACEFQYAHGYAFITDGFGGGIPALAQGYLALIVPADRTIVGGNGESLGN
jgi:hypothetical protein